MLRKLVQLQRMSAGQNGSGKVRSEAPACCSCVLAAPAP